MTGLFSRSAGYDSRQLALQTLSLFNQRTQSRLSKLHWKGDWIFRRDRLEMVDAGLRNFKPDILLLQEALTRRGSVSESDRSILGAGALEDYAFRLIPVREFQDTQEIEFLGVAVQTPLKLLPPLEEEREVWSMGNDGFMMVVELDYEDQPVVVFNVQMPSSAGDKYLWYRFVHERVVERIRMRKLCPKRVVIGGYLPGDEGSARFADFVRQLELKDSSTGFCQTASRCYTATPINDVFMATIGDETPSRPDRIFVHQSAIVYSSLRNINEDDPNNRYARRYGLSRLWPSQRFGWAASVRLARCNDEELGVVRELSEG